mmetsp:Transcript_59371/g.165785  ORF Transcript_59371/g.165785 Transcript_59371/m.165785 type:complete len:140 (+) Transcript_59371:168-587(+)
MALFGLGIFGTLYSAAVLSVVCLIWASVGGAVGASSALCALVPGIHVRVVYRVFELSEDPILPLSFQVPFLAFFTAVAGALASLSVGVLCHLLGYGWLWTIFLGLLVNSMIFGTGFIGNYMYFIETRVSAEAVDGKKVG